MFGEKVTFGSAGWDENGDPVTGGDVTLPGCIVEWLGSSESIATTRSGASETVRVYSEHQPSSPIRNGDDMTVRGKTFRVSGISDDWVDPEETGFGGIVITGKRGEG